MKFCDNCGHIFKTGLLPDEQQYVKRNPNTPESEELIELYDEVCPYCGAYPPGTFWEWLYLKIHRK